MEKATVSKRRVWPWVVLAVIALIAATLTYGYHRAKPYATIGATYLAKQMCSCVFVTGRTEGSCRAEFKPDIDRFSVKVDRTGAPTQGRVTASLAMFAGAATYEDGYGCTVAK